MPEDTTILEKVGPMPGYDEKPKRTMSPEELEAARARMAKARATALANKAARKAAPGQSANELLSIPKTGGVQPQPSAKAISQAQLMLARAIDAPKITSQSIESVGSTVNGETETTTAKVTHTRAAHARVYVLTPHGVMVKQVNSQTSTLREVLASPTHSPVCWDCGSDECSGETNGCTGRPKRMLRRCPVPQCRKPIYDPKPTGKFLREDDVVHTKDESGDDMELLIDDSSDYYSTPQQRTKALMDAHILKYHPGEAAQMGLSEPVLVQNKQGV